MNPSIIATAIGAISAGLTFALTSTGLWRSAPWPLVWPDVALVYWLCLLGLAAAVGHAARGGGKSHSARLVVAVLALLVFPPFYIYVRIASEAQRAYELLGESRFGEAQSLLDQILRLRSGATWNNVNLREANERLQALIAPIEARIQLPLESNAASDTRLARARDLAMLGRTEESLSALDASPALDDSPEASVLRGAIHEAQGRWQTALDWYARAVKPFVNEPVDASAEPVDTRLKALSGIGHCERKLGRLHQAEAAYSQLLALAPTAETHFLVAQFYEDTQQTSLAKAHARQAVVLAPDHFKDRARHLETKLSTTHFGCFSAFSGR